MSKRILLQNGKILLDDENKVLTTEDGTSALKLVEEGQLSTDGASIRLQNDLDYDSIYIIHVYDPDDRPYSFILSTIRQDEASLNSSLEYNSIEQELAYINCDSLNTLEFYGITVNSYYKYRIYKLQGGGNSVSTGTKLKKQNYIKEIHPKNILVKAFKDSADFLNETIMTFTQAVDIVVEEPRPKRFRKNTTSKPSLYRPIGGLRKFTNKESLTLFDILQMLGITNSTDISINAVYNLAKARGRNTKYIVLQDSNYTLENRRDLTADTHTNSNANNHWIISDFERNEKWTSLQLNFIFKPVTNYQEIKKHSSATPHYTYLTGTHALEVNIVLTYKPEETLNNNNLKYLIDYKIVELD